MPKEDIYLTVFCHQREQTAVCGFSSGDEARDDLIMLMFGKITVKKSVQTATLVLYKKNF